MGLLLASPPAPLLQGGICTPVKICYTPILLLWFPLLLLLNALYDIPFIHIFHCWVPESENLRVRRRWIGHQALGPHLICKNLIKRFEYLQWLETHFLRSYVTHSCRGFLVFAFCFCFYTYLTKVGQQRPSQESLKDGRRGAHSWNGQAPFSLISLSKPKDEQRR